jgi:hypothetical protein
VLIRRDLISSWSAAIALALVSLTVLSACGVSADDAEQAITDQSHERLTEPECEEVDRDFEEETFVCSAAQPDGRRIKLQVWVNEKRDEPEISVIEWPCLSAETPWRPIRRNPALRCGRPLSGASS